jgi:hypothetical protein
MNFEIYCDESRPELLALPKETRAGFMMLGGLWLPETERGELKEAIQDLREEHRCFGEAKWVSVSDRYLPFYLGLVDLFFDRPSDVLRFRCLAVDATRVDLMTYHEDDQELGFYKFYYQLIHHWILDFNDYRIFLDMKTRRNPARLDTLQRCLQYTNLSSDIVSIQSLPSREVALIQWTDLLLGAAGAAFNGCVTSTAKRAVLSRIEEHLGRPIRPTPKAEPKFNIFKIDLAGGW